MSPRTPSKRPFPEGPFLVEEAQNAGIPQRRLRARDLAAPYYGVRTTRLEPRSLRENCEAILLRLPPTAVFSHGTAALLHRIPVPLPIEQDARLHVSLPTGRRAVDAAGIVGHQVAFAAGDWDYLLGFAVTTPERTWCDLGTMLSLPALVAAGDSLIFHGRMLSTKSRLESAVARYAGRRGRRVRRRALELLSDRSESPRESRLRVAIVESDLPVPEVNAEILDAAGRFVARVDLCYRQLMIALEYEGDHHRTDKRQWRRDIARIRSLQSLGWRVLRYTDDDLQHPAAFLAELALLLP